MANMAGKTIALLEARRSQEMAALVVRHGGVPYLSPALREAPLENREEIARFVDILCQGSIHVIIFLTGVGCRAFLQSTESLGRLPQVLEALARIKVVARGPKPVVVLYSYKVRIDFVPPEPNTSEEILAELRSWHLDGKTVAIQLYGGSTPFLEVLRRGLQKLGAKVLEISLYSWRQPLDLGPLLLFLEDCRAGKIDVLAITSSSQVNNLFEVAENLGKADVLRETLNTSVLVASVGPVSSQALREHGVKVTIQPEHGKMGHLVLAIAEHLEVANQRQGESTLRA